MKIKTSELAGAALDYAVALCERAGVTGADSGGILHAVGGGKYCPSSDWAQGGRIIAAQKISVHFCRDMCDRNGRYVHATTGACGHHGYWRGDHDQPLVAAMRCYVASRLGEYVEVHEELVR